MQSFPKPNDMAYSDEGMLDRVPENVSFLASEPNSSIPLASIGFKWHAAAKHLAITNYQPPAYYEDYVMTTSCSEKIQDLQRSQAAKLAAMHEGPQGIRNFVEIGCGDGSFMKHMQGRVSRVLGVEPSKRFAAEAIAAGFDVLNGYVGSANKLTDEMFDGFAARQVFEHLPDPLDVLVGIRKMLNVGAVGLIEVPNGERALRLRRFFEFFPDHVNYYSVNSLVALASDAGFCVTSCREAFGGDYLELWLLNEPVLEQAFNEIRIRREEVVVALTKSLTELNANNLRVAIWGAGAKTLSILAACPPGVLPLICGIVDSDPHKHGRYIPNTAIRIVSPEQATSLRADAVFVLALSYREEIATSIRKAIDSCRVILTLDNHGRIAEI